MLPKTSPNYLQYKIHKRWLLSWIHVIVKIRVTTFEYFKMQMVIKWAPVSLSNKKVNFYTCPRLTFLKKNARENAYKSISEPLDFKMFWLLPCCGFEISQMIQRYSSWSIPVEFPSCCHLTSRLKTLEDCSWYSKISMCSPFVAKDCLKTQIS